MIRHLANYQIESSVGFSHFWVELGCSASRDGGDWPLAERQLKGGNPR
jgi:hypothetical protein